MRFILRMAKVAPDDRLVFDDLKKAINAACVAIEFEDAHPEEILAEDGRVLMTHDQISAEWARRLKAGQLQQNRALG